MEQVFRELNWGTLNEAQRREALRRPTLQQSAQQAAALENILRQVQEQGDQALFELTKRFDGVELDQLVVPEADINRAVEAIRPHEHAALKRAASQIECFHRACMPTGVDQMVSEGVRCARHIRAIENVGLYVPGGTAPLPSSVLMLGIPAKLAGCATRVLCTPPQRDGSVHDGILAAARLVGIEHVYCVGGAQAIAAMAFGTASVPKVDKIFGPGNSWVTGAKQLVALDPAGAACDMPAGPSELLVIADGDANPEFVASDLLSQAEHGVDSQVILVTTCADLLSKVRHAMTAQLSSLPRCDIATQALAHSLLVCVDTMDEALALSNDYAPEHLIVNVTNPRSYLDRIKHAGSVFLGPWTPESVGDYASGTNHVLPTSGFARSYSGLSVAAFCKQITVQELTASGLQELGPTVETLATMEGLDAHCMAVRVRLNNLERHARGEKK